MASDVSDDVSRADVAAWWLVTWSDDVMMTSAAVYWRVEERAMFTGAWRRSP